MPGMSQHFTYAGCHQGLLSSGLGTLSEGLCFVHLGVLGLRERSGGGYNTTHAIYSQLGSKPFKLRNYLVKESLGAVLGDVGIVGLASTG